jgi:hypothetical protein
MIQAGQAMAPRFSVDPNGGLQGTFRMRTACSELSD